MSGKTSRNKGSSYENVIAAVFRAAGFPNAKRHLEYQIEEGNQGRDLDGTQPFAIQVKHWKKSPPITVLNDVIEDEQYRIRVAILKKTAMKKSPGLEVAVLDASVFFKLIDILVQHNLIEDLCEFDV